MITIIISTIKNNDNNKNDNNNNNNNKNKNKNSKVMNNEDKITKQ